MPKLNAATFFGEYEAPQGPLDYQTGDITGLTFFFNNFLKVIIVGGGLFTLINLVISGIQYIGSSGNPEAVKQLSSRIWLSTLGILIIGGSIAVAALIGFIFYGDSTIILSPEIPAP